jgi:6-phosphogluconolactonase
VDHTGKCVFAANYGSGSAASFHVGEGGRLSDAVSFFQYGDPAPPRPAGGQPPPAAQRPAAGQQPKRSHVHRATASPGNGYVLFNDLGLDMIHVYKLDAATAKLTPADPPEWLSTPGAGPRGLRWHPNKKIAYCVNEKHPTVNVLNWDEKKGVLTTLQEVSLVPADYTAAPGKGCAPGDIVFDKQMQHGYVTSRLDDFMATFKVEKDGKLTLMEHTTSGGIRERDCTLDPTDGWLLVANPDSNNIAVMKRDQTTGRLSQTVTTSVTIGSPMCLIFPERPNVAL